MSHTFTTPPVAAADGYFITIATAAATLGDTPWGAWKLAANGELGTPLRAPDQSGPILVRRDEVETLRAGRAELDACPEPLARRVSGPAVGWFDQPRPALTAEVTIRRLRTRGKMPA